VSATVAYAAAAVLICLVVYRVGGPAYALGALLLLGALYAGSVWLITASM
jgi:hypothetical protein